jgi:uncharacterized protein (DUF2237 family)
LNETQRNAVLERARRQLDKLVADHKMSTNERDLRIHLLKAVMTHEMGFSSTAEPSHEYYEEINGRWCLKRGKVAEGLDDRVYNRSGHSATGCRRAIQTVMLEALSQLAKSLGKEKADAFDAAVAGKNFDELFPTGENTEFHAYSEDPKLTDLIPGDRVRMDNHRWEEGDETGNEGSNVIFLGKDANGTPRFVHMDTAYVETLNELRKTVQQYSPASKQDPNLFNYKFDQRYRPLIPPCLGP